MKPERNDGRHWPRWMGACVILCGLTASLPAEAQQTQPPQVPQDIRRDVQSAVPQSWLSYGQRVGEQFQATLEGDDEAASEFHRVLDDRVLNTKAAAPLTAILVRAWIGADGTITRVQFDSLGDERADALLRQLLTTGSTVGVPPADMRQPLRVRLRLKPSE